MDYRIVQKVVSQKRDIVITAHKSPDGDALGSSLALYHIFKDTHNVKVIVPNDYPDYLKWLPGNENVLIYEGNEAICDSYIQDSDLLFCLDFNKLYRTHTMVDILTDFSGFKIMIDHHEEPDDFCDQVLSNTFISSTAELIFSFLRNLDYKLTKDVAVCLYTGILTDTGSFKYPNVTIETHKIVAELMSFDIEHHIIHKKIYDSQSISRLELLKICLGNLVFFNDLHSAVTFLMEKDLTSCNYKKGDTEGFVNLPLAINGIHFSTFFIQFKDGIKVSFRSQGSFDVNLFSKLYFNGGGHKNAAGGFIDDRNMKETIIYFKKVLKTYLAS